MNDLITIANGTAILDVEASKKIADFERKLKEIKEKEDELKKAILEEMESKAILRIETEDFIISYKATYDRESFDSKKFRAEHEDLFDDYVKLTPVKSSIVLKLKG